MVEDPAPIAWAGLCSQYYLRCNAFPLAIPVLLNKYSRSKGVPVLIAAVTRERARMVAAASAAAAVVAGGERIRDWDRWRPSRAREMYSLIKPAHVMGLSRDGEELPEPVSAVVATRVYWCAPYKTLLWRPLFRRSNVD